jgi:hypothetical protein
LGPISGESSHAENPLDHGFVRVAASLYFAKDGFNPMSQWEVAVAGDTRLDIEVVRR